MAYSSITYHWYAMRSGMSDPAPIPTEWVFAIKLLGGLVFLAALLLTFTQRDDATTANSPTASLAVNQEGGVYAGSPQK